MFVLGAKPAATLRKTRVYDPPPHIPQGNDAAVRGAKANGAPQGHGRGDHVLTTTLTTFVTIWGVSACMARDIAHPKAKIEDRPPRGLLSRKLDQCPSCGHFASALKGAMHSTHTQGPCGAGGDRRGKASCGRPCGKPMGSDGRRLQPRSRAGRSYRAHRPTSHQQIAPHAPTRQQRQPHPNNDVPTTGAPKAKGNTTIRMPHHPTPYIGAPGDAPGAMEPRSYVHTRPRTVNSN